MAITSATLSSTTPAPLAELSTDEIDMVAGGAKLDLTLKRDPKGSVSVGVGVEFDNKWKVGGSVGTDGSGSVSVTIPL